MTKNLFILDGTLAEALSRAQMQLDSDATYSKTLVLQDLVRDPQNARECDDYMGDLSGRFLGAVRVFKEQSVRYDERKSTDILKAALRMQNPDGSFGPALPAFHTDHGQAWGHGRLLDGLLDAREWAPTELQEELGAAIVALGDYGIAQSVKWARWITANNHVKFVLDPVSYARPLLRLYRENRDERYLEAAAALLSVLPEGRQGLHSHGRLLALRARLMELCIRGKDLAALAAEVARLRSLIVLENGSVLESVSEVRDINTEACATADWIMLNLEMHEITGEYSYFEDAQFSLFNGLLHAQSTNGHFGCETLYLDGEILTIDYAPEAWWCCTFHGIEAIGAFARSVLATQSDGTRTLLAPLPGSSADAAVRVSGEYPEHGSIAIETTGKLSVNIPSSGTLTDLATGLVYTTKKILDTGTSTLLFEPQLHLVSNGSMFIPPFSNSTVTGPVKVRGRVTVRKGLLLLALGAHVSDAADVLRARAFRFNSLSASFPKVTCTGYNAFAQEMTLFPMGTRRLDEDSLVRISFDQVELS